jgi:hypothetical protein
VGVVVGRGGGCVCDDRGRATGGVCFYHDHSVAPEILLAMFMIIVLFMVIGMTVVMIVKFVY